MIKKLKNGGARLMDRAYNGSSFSGKSVQQSNGVVWWRAIEATKNIVKFYFEGIGGLQSKRNSRGGLI